MKKLFIVLTSILLCAGVFAAPATKKAKIRKVIDFQGREMGAEIPKWIKEGIEGNQEGLSKELGLDSSKTYVIFATAKDSDVERAVEAAEDIANAERDSSVFDADLREKEAAFWIKYGIPKKEISGKNNRIKDSDCSEIWYTAYVVYSAPRTK